MKLLGTQFFRSLISRIRTTRVRQRKRPPQTEVQKSPEVLETRIVPATFTEVGDQLKLNLDQMLSNVSVTATPKGYKFTLGDYAAPETAWVQEPAAKTWTGSDSANVTGNGTSTLIVTAAGMGSINSVDIFTSFQDKFFVGASLVTFTDSGANSYRSSFNVTINDPFASFQKGFPNAGQVKFEGTTSFTGGAGISVFTNANIVVGPGSTVSTTNGNLTLNGNQDPGTLFNRMPGQLTYTTRDDTYGKDFNGVDIAGAIQSSGAGLITIAGRSIDRAAGDAQGVVIRETGQITAGAVGGISIIGTGGSGAGAITGVLDLGQSISTTGANISIVGVGGEGAAANSVGVVIGTSSTISVTGAGSVSVRGTGGAGAGGAHYGVRMLGTITTTSGDVIVNGVGGGIVNLADITAPGDPVQIYGGSVAFGEGPERAIDNNSAGSAKYANSGKAGTGLIVTPNAGPQVVQGIRITTGSDDPNRDPATYRLEGADNPNGPFTLISEGVLNLPDARGAIGGLIQFANTTAYRTYRITFPTLKNAALAPAMQIGELELLRSVSDPSMIDEDGVVLDGKILAAGNASITVNGAAGPGRGTNSDGVRINANGLIQATGTGAITVVGTAGKDVDSGSSAGVIVSGKVIGGASGPVKIAGDGGTGTAILVGVNILKDGTSAGSVTSAGASIEIVGKGGDGPAAESFGVKIDGTVRAGGSGMTTVTGTGGAGGNAHAGVSIKGTVSASGGNVAVTGTGGGSGSSRDEAGIIVGDGGVIAAEGIGNLTVTGTGGATNGILNDGIVIQANGAIKSNGIGAVTIVGRAGANQFATANGIFLVGLISGSNSGLLTVRGEAVSGNGGQYGLYMYQTGTISSSGANVEVHGTSGTGGSTDAGVYLDPAATITAGGTGNVLVKGTGGSGGLGRNGITNLGTITSGGGAVTVTGTGGGSGGDSSGYGVWLFGNGTITAGNNGPIAVTGESGPGNASSSYGVLASGGSRITSNSGSITVIGSSAAGLGISIDSSITNTGAGSDGGIALIADSMKIDGTVNAGSKTVLIRPRTAGTTIGLGSVLLDVTAPGDPVFEVGGQIAFGEGPDRAIDNSSGGAQKYANSGKENSGLVVTPRVGATLVQGLRISTGSDDPNRDPASYKLEGAMSPNGPFTLISQGNLNLPMDRSTAGGVIQFTNNTIYTSYRLTFPTLRNAGAAPAMQVGEIELLGQPAYFDVTTPGDPVTVVGGNIAFGEGPDRAIDNNLGGTAKYANDGKAGTGLTVTPSLGLTVVTGLRISTASDGVPTDPTSYKIEGGFDPNGPFTLISEGTLNLPTERSARGDVVTFANTAAYKTYRITFPTVRDINAAVVMQFSELELFVSGKQQLILDDAQLDRISAGTLRIGGLESGAITVLSDVTRPAKTDMTLTSSQYIIGTDKINLAGGVLTTFANGNITNGLFVDKQGLRFYSTGPFTNDATSGEVLIGYVPTGSEPFRPLLYLSDGATLTTTGSETTLTTSGKISTFIGRTLFDLFIGPVFNDPTKRISIPLKALTTTSFDFSVDQAYQTQTPLLPKMTVTPVSVRLFPSGPVRVQLFANLGYEGLGGAGVRLGTGPNRLDLTDSNIVLIQDAPTSTIPVVPSGYDSNGQPTPIRFSVLGLNFQTNSLNATWDRATGLPIFRGIATASFQGGSIDVEFGAGGTEGIRIGANGSVDLSNTTVKLRKLTLGGIDFNTDQMVVGLDFGNSRIVIEGTSNSLKQGIDFGTIKFESSGSNRLVLKNGVLNSENAFLESNYPYRAFFQLNTYAYGPYTLKGSLSFFLNPQTNDWTMIGGNTVQFERAGSINGISASNEQVFKAFVTLARITPAGLADLRDGLHIVNGEFAGFQFPVYQFSLQRLQTPESVYLDRFEFTQGSANNLLATYDAINKEFRIQGTANAKGATARQFYPGLADAEQGATYSTQAYFGSKGTAGLVMYDQAPNQDQVSFGLGDIPWGGTTFRSDSLAVTYNRAASSFQYSGGATWLYDGQQIPVLPDTGNSQRPSGLEGFRINGQFKIDGLTLQTNDFHLVFIETNLLSAIPYGPTGISNATFLFDNKVSPIKTSLDLPNKELFVFRNGALVKSDPNNIPRLITTLPFVVDGINLANSSGKIDLPNTPTNPSNQFAAPLGTVDFVISDVRTRAIAQLPLALKDGGLSAGNGARFIFNEGVEIQGIKFAPNALVATYNAADRRYTFVGTGVYKGPFKDEDVTVGGPPSKVQIIEERGVFKLIGFNPPPQDLTLTGVIFKTSLMTPVKNGAIWTYTGTTAVDIGGTRLNLDFGGNGTPGLVYDTDNRRVVAFGASVGGAFTIGGASVTAMGTLSYDSTKDELGISGAAGFRFNTTTGPVTAQVNLGSPGTPGLVIKDGQVRSLQASVTATFKLFGIDVNVRNLGITYSADRQEYGFYGTIGLSTPAIGGKKLLDNFSVTLGAGPSSPGLVVKNGEFERLDVQLNGSINLYGVTATPDRLRMVYTRASNTLAITGGLTVSLAGRFTATASFTGQGLLVNLQTGEVQIKGLVLKVGNVQFGNLGIRNLEFRYDVDNNGNTRIQGSCTLSLPMGIECGGSVTIVNNRLSSISFEISRAPGIPVGTPPLIYLTSIRGELTGLDDLNNFGISATVTGTVGPSVRIFGQTRGLIKIQGQVSITRDKFEFNGNVQLLEGTLGSGTGRLTLFFSGNEVLRVQASINLFPGDILRGNLNFTIDRSFNITLTGDLGVYVPNGVPKIGGKGLGTLSVYLQIRPNEARENSYASFKAKVLKVFEIGGRANFAGRIEGYVDPPIIKAIKFGFDIPGAREFNFPIGDPNDGQPVDVAPPVLILDEVASVPDSPGALIKFTALTNLPETTTIDLYVDSEPGGYGGHLIASGIAFAEGQQTFEWSDLAMYASQPYDTTKPVYIYGVINDGSNFAVMTPYSEPILPPNYVPGIYVPDTVEFAAGDSITFASTNDIPILIDDPLAQFNPSAVVSVTVSVQNGRLTLPIVESEQPDAGEFPGIPGSTFPEASGNVTIEGDGTGRIVLIGTADDINARLNGLVYTPNDNALRDDLLHVELGRYPDFYEEKLEANTLLKVHSLMLGFEDGYVAMPQTYDAGSDPMQVLSHVAINDAASGRINGATISIGNYEQNKDFLDLAIDDQLDLGITATFDPRSGVLKLSGSAFVEQYERALHLLTFGSTGSGTKSLTIGLGDNLNEQGSFTELIDVLTVNQAPIVQPGAGLVYPTGGGAMVLDQAITVTDPENGLITSATVAFDPGTYVQGEDFLLYVNANGIDGTFDPANGLLTLTGEATAPDYTAALQSINYVNSPTGAATTGVRELTVTVNDGQTINGKGSAALRLVVDDSGAALTGPTLDLQRASVTAAGDETPIILAPSATLSGAGLIQSVQSLTVAITGNFEPGADFLRIKGIPDGITGTYDELNGLLRLEGAAPLNYYEYVVQQITYANHATVRSGQARTITFTIDDGFTAPVSQSITVEVPSLPVIDAGYGSLNYRIGKSAEVINSQILVEYLGGPTLTGATVRISGNYMTGQDQLLFTDQGSITGSFDSNTGVLTLTGTAAVADYQLALTTVQYRNSRMNPTAGFRAVTFSVNDGQITSAEVETFINVDGIIQAPTISLSTIPFTFVEGTSMPISIASSFTVADQDAPLPDDGGLHVDGATVSISNDVPGEDLLTFTSTSNIIGMFNSAQGVLQLSGRASFAEYQAVLRSVNYENVSEAPSTATRSITISLIAGAMEMSAPSVQVSVVSLNNPPSRTSGVIDEVTLLQNSAPISLGLDDLAFAPPSAKEPTLWAIPVNLPSDVVGQITLADGSTVELGKLYTIDELRGMHVEPAFGKLGSGVFTFNIQATDPITGNLDPAALTESVTITVDGTLDSTQNQRYVSQVYRDLLGRNPSPSQQQSWVTLLDGGSPRSQFIDAIVGSAEYRTRLVTETYRNLLLRAPSQAELEQQVGVLTAGGKIETIREQILGSDEFIQLNSSNGQTSFITALYLELFERNPTSIEIQAGLTSLASNETPAQFASRLSKTVKANQMVVEDLYNGLLHRSASGAERVALGKPAGYPGVDGLNRQITISDEYYDRYASGLVPFFSFRAVDQETNAYESVGMLADNAGHAGSATLISGSYLLTAAHLIAGRNPADFTFQLNGTTLTVSEFVVHPNYNSALLGQDGANDIALVKLSAPVTNVVPSQLYRQSPLIADDVAFVGFGARGSQPFGTKRIGYTPIDGLTSQLITWNFDDTGESNTGPGDSGSPLYITNNGIQYLAGVVSGGTDPNGGLGDLAYNTRVDTYLSWIESITSTEANVPPQFTSSTTFTVAENIVSIGTVAATDVNLPVQALTYSITGGADAARFALTSGGILTFNSAPDFDSPNDAGADNVYELQITANDGAGGMTAQNVTATVTPVNDNTPVFTSFSAINLDENQTSVGTVTATDSDAPSQPLTFSITGGADAAKFSITSSGILTFNASPDFETPTDAGGNNAYELQVTASDGAGGTTVQNITVTVVPVNESGPAFTSRAAFTMPENQTSAGIVTATDPDLPTGTVTFGLTGGADAARFNITNDGILTFKSAPNYEAPADTDGDNVYELQVTADDGAGQTTVQTMSVTVTNVAEGPTITLAGIPLTYQVAKKPISRAIDAAATLDLGGTNPSFNGAKLTVALTADRTSTDILKVVGLPGSLLQKGKKLLLGKTLVGTVSGGKGKIPELTITFTSAATRQLVEQTIQKVSFSTRTVGTGSRAIQMHITGVGGQSSNQAARLIDLD